MTQQDAATRRKSQRHATTVSSAVYTGVLGPETQQQEQQAQSVNQLEPRTAPRQRKRRGDKTDDLLEQLSESRTRTRMSNQSKETNPQKTEGVSGRPGSEQLESGTRTRRTKELKQNALGVNITTGKQEITVEEGGDEDLVGSRPETEFTKEPKQGKRKRTVEDQDPCGTEETGQLIEPKNRIKRTNKSKETRSSNATSGKSRGSEKHEDQESETRTQTRKSKHPKQTNKNITETQIMSGSKESEKELVDNGTRTRSEKEQTRACLQSQRATKGRSSTVAVTSRSRRRGRLNQTKTDLDVNNTGSQNGHEPDVDPQKTSSLTVATSSNVVKQTHRFSNRSRQKDSPSASPERCPDPANSAEDQANSNLEEEADNDDAKVDDEEKNWHELRLSAHQLPRSIDDAIILPVSCGGSQAQLVLNRLESGSRGACVRLLDGSWLTPNEFQLISGRGNAKDWKRSIRHHGHSLKSLVEQGLLSLASPPLCICEHCDVQVTFISK